MGVEKSRPLPFFAELMQTIILAVALETHDILFVNIKFIIWLFFLFCFYLVYSNQWTYEPGKKITLF